MVYIPTKPLEHIARDSHAIMTELAKGLAAGAAEDAPPTPIGWMEFLVAIRAAELAVLLTWVKPDEQQRVADEINTFLAFTPVRFRLTPIS